MDMDDNNNLMRVVNNGSMIDGSGNDDDNA